MTVTTAREHGRLTERVSRACAVARPPEELLARVSDILRPALEHVAGGWLVVDPHTGVGTRGHTEGCTDELHLALLALERRGDDVNLLSDLVSVGAPAVALSTASAGDLSLSRRWREVYQPHGYGDELRGALVVQGTAWGAYTVVRSADGPWFGDAEVALMAQVGPSVAAALRTGLVLHRGHDEPGGEPGVVTLDPGGAVLSQTGTAQRLLGTLSGPAAAPTPGYAVHEVAARARALADGVPGPPALARVPVPEDGWLMLRATLLPGDAGTVAVVVEPAGAAEVLPILLELHELTLREQEVTRALLGGLDTAQLATALSITPETVRGHLKAIFGKLGVRSRPQLMAMLTGPSARRSGLPRGG